MTVHSSAAGNRHSSALDRVISMAVFLAITSAVAAAGSIATRNGQDWYDGLEKPSFNPPDWVFGPVWSTLYVFMAVAAWLVWRRRGAMRNAGLTLWGVQLCLNLAWSWIFFGAQQPGMALVEIAALFVAIVLTMVLFAMENRAAAMFMVPYLGWVGFAAVLNFEIWRLN